MNTMTMATGMKTLFIAATVMAASTLTANAQADSIYLHNGEIVGGKVLKVSEKTVTFTYVDEDAQQTLGKYAVARVVFGKSKRVQDVSDRIIVRSKEDWENVIVIQNTDEVAGLKRRTELKGKTRQINYRTGEGSDKTALKKLKMDAAENGCPFVFITTDKDIDRKSDDGGSWGQVQSIKKGVGYAYN
jgi:hypothetical protein